MKLIRAGFEPFGAGPRFEKWFWHKIILSYQQRINTSGPGYTLRKTKRSGKPTPTHTAQIRREATSLHGESSARRDFRPTGTFVMPS